MLPLAGLIPAVQSTCSPGTLVNHNMTDLHSKTVLITGGSRGIGAATAIAFAKQGANVAFTYHRDDAAARRVEEELASHGVLTMSLRTESHNELAHASFVEQIVGEWGRLDVAVANAGIWKRAPITEMTAEDFHETMDANMTGTFILAKVAARAMIQQGSGGSIVIVSSTAGQRGEAFYSHYAASKGAQISFTKSLAVELAPSHIRVNSVAPGWVDTDMTHAAMANEGMTQISRGIPLGHPARAEDIANAVLFLAGSGARHITGEILNVNGGSVLCG